MTLAFLLASCGGMGTHRGTPLELTIAHINDHHSHLEALPDQIVRIGGVDTQVELGGFTRLASAFRSYEGRDNVLRLHAGDASTGTLYYTLFKGRADADMMNTICFDAMAVGNHEFDDGDAQLKSFIEQLHTGPCKTPVLSANVHPQRGTPLAPQNAEDYIQPYAIKNIRGIPVGIIGITIKRKTQDSSSPLPSTSFEDETSAAQRTIDQLKARGIRHIVLLTHQGYQADKAMATKLSDVDVIIGGDSHTLLGNFSKQRHLPKSAGPYPTRVANRDGKPVCVGQAWEFSKAMGEMNVSFNAEGDVTSCTGQASLIIGDRFKRKDAAGKWVAVDPATPQKIAAEAATDASLKMLAEDAIASNVLRSYSSQTEKMQKESIGEASQALCLVRTPGESFNASGEVAGCEEANQRAHGSDVTQLVAQSFLRTSLRADLALHNAGGVRIPVPAGAITLGQAFALMPFNNVLIELPVTGEQIIAVLEDAVSSYLDAGRSSGGGHPYAAGLRWHLDMSQPKGRRFSRLETKDRQSGTWASLDPARTYIVATHEFLARGQGGYASFKPIYDSGNYVNTHFLYTQAFVDYVRAHGKVQRPAPADYSHQAVTTQAGVVLH